MTQADLAEWLRCRDAGTGDQDPHRAELAPGCVHGLIHLGPVADVGLARHGLGAVGMELLGHSNGSVPIEVHDADGVPVSGQVEADGAAHTGSSPGDDSNADQWLPFVRLMTIRPQVVEDRLSRPG